MKGKTTILLVITVLFVLVLASIPVSTGDPPPTWNKNIGDVYFRNGAAINEVDSTAQGIRADIYYHIGWLTESRYSHTQYDFFDKVRRPPGSYTVMGTVPTDTRRFPEGDNIIWWFAVKYYVVGLKTLTTTVWTTEYQTPQIQTTLITINTGGTIPSVSWTFALFSDFTTYSDSTIEIAFSDTDYEKVDVPDAGDTTDIETENGHEIELTTDSGDEILYITVGVASPAVTWESTLELA